ncbi:hypothetical protein AGABI1DRAFT_129181 [Agaricus bisporus var. burnettii JB137-S8]|uniref:Uncharacterized protein n=1 Tax=Agaricus bisporus var. burnettii (strain JB137-S8 / ATCC MYA-4627 / FGSC 10392) TaxID=597362 RepID=K5VWQ8_AGABU|nr:uncharacterized protein AGABI1DRAFT_129181 [Agaricus bisporus var. burnettii JB137-S8]EKM78909.1 hypothetical protein AGABI1DRAFT_129181 [Agaricus bisporus var. burnettii JB137-S8]
MLAPKGDLTKINRAQFSILFCVADTSWRGLISWEDFTYRLPLGDDEGNFVEEQNGNKRRRIEIKNEDAGSDSDEEISGPPAGVRQPPPAEEPPQPQGLLSAGALEGLKYFAEIRKKNGTASAPPQTHVKSSTPELGLGDYGSDDDD